MSIKIGNLDISKLMFGNSEISKVYLGNNEIYSSGPAFTGLCFTAQQSNSTVELCRFGNPSIANTAYSLDGTTWVSFTPAPQGTSGVNKITLANIGDKVYFKNDIADNFDSVNFLIFKMTGLISASGNCNSIYNSSNFESLNILAYVGCYRSLFLGCTSLTTIPELPSTTLSDYCYSNMFNACTSLTTIPSLPATTLASNCYYHMFNGCTSLTSVPSLPATTLTSYCYSNMFDGCTSLTTIPSLPATTLAVHCYSRMFNGCTSLQKLPKLPATTLPDYCYSRMFNSCRPSIKLSTIQTSEYQYAYRIPYIETGTIGTDSLDNMFSYTGGTFTGTPTINTTYYTSNEVI